MSLVASGSGSEAVRLSTAAVGVRSTERTDLRRTLHCSGVDDGVVAPVERWNWSKKSRLREMDANADRELLSVCSSSWKPNAKKKRGSEKKTAVVAQNGNNGGCDRRRTLSG